MSYHGLDAKFFCRPDGVVFPLARPLSQRVKDIVWDRDEAVCANCGRLPLIGCRVAPFSQKEKEGFYEGHVDHILPRKRGGQNELLNLQILCWRCNLSKKAEDQCPNG